MNELDEQYRKYRERMFISGKDFLIVSFKEFKEIIEKEVNDGRRK